MEQVDLSKDKYDYIILGSGLIETSLSAYNSTLI